MPLVPNVSLASIPLFQFYERLAWEMSPGKFAETFLHKHRPDRTAMYVIVIMENKSQQTYRRASLV